MNNRWYEMKYVRGTPITLLSSVVHICLVQCSWRKGPLMASGGRNWFPNAYLEFRWVFLPSFKDWMIWSAEKTGIRGRFFLPIIILLQDSKDTLTSASALARNPKHNYFSSSLTPGCSSWYFWMGPLRAPGHTSSDLPWGKQVSWTERWEGNQAAVFSVFLVWSRDLLPKL